MTTQQRKGQFHFRPPSAWNLASRLATKARGCRLAYTVIFRFPGAKMVGQAMILRGKQSVSCGNSLTGRSIGLKIFRVAHRYDTLWPIAWMRVVSPATTVIPTALKRIGNWETSEESWKSFAR